MDNPIEIFDDSKRSIGAEGMSESDVAGAIPSLELASNLGVGANITKDANLGADGNATGANGAASNPTLPTISRLITSLASLTANSLGTPRRHPALPFNHVTRATKGTSLGALGSGITAWGRNMSRATFVSSEKPFEDTQDVEVYERFLDADDVDEP